MRLWKYHDDENSLKNSSSLVINTGQFCILPSFFDWMGRFIVGIMENELSDDLIHYNAGISIVEVCSNKMFHYLNG